MKKRTGVFVCHCGINIAGTVDVKKVAEKLSKNKNVAHSEDYVYMCSDPGQNLIIDAIKEKDLDSIVVSCCSPTLHEKTFQNAAKAGGIRKQNMDKSPVSAPRRGSHQEKKA